MKRKLIAAALGLAVFVSFAGSSLAVIVIGGMPEKACEAPASEQSRDHVQRVRGGAIDPNSDCTLIIEGGKDRR